MCYNLNIDFEVDFVFSCLLGGSVPIVFYMLCILFF